jgi:hypothetical protein
MITSHQEGSMELIYALDRRRLQRELRRREAALREAAEVPQAAEPKPESLVSQYASMTRGWWECDFCGRGFHGYGQFLNHNCHEPD